MQTGFVGSFNGRISGELLNETLILDLDDPRAKIAAWVVDFNIVRPHSAFLVPPKTVSDQLKQCPHLHDGLLAVDGRSVRADPGYLFGMFVEKAPADQDVGSRIGCDPA